MEGQLGGNQQCLKCTHGEQVASPEADDNPLLPKIYHCRICHKDYENAHAYSGHFNIHKKERMNSLVLSSMTPLKRKDQAADLKSGKGKVEQKFSKGTPTKKDEASCSRDTPCNQPLPRLPTTPICGAVSQSLGNQMQSGNVGNLTRGSPNRSPDTDVVHPRNIGNTSHGSITRSIEVVPMPSRNVCNHPAARHNPLQGSQSGRVVWAQPIIPMSRGPVQAQFGRAGWPRPSNIGNHVSQRPLQSNQSDYLRWARHFGVDPMARVPLQAGSQFSHVGRGRPFGNPTHGLAQGSQFGHVQRARPFDQPMSYGPTGGSQSGHFGLPKPNHMNHGPASGSHSGWQRPFRNGNPMVPGPLQGSHQNGSVGWPRPTQIGNPRFNGPSQGSLQSIQQGGWAGHANPVYVDCNIITTTVRITGSDVPGGVRIGLNTVPENLSTGENITSTEGGTGTSRDPPEGGHGGEMKPKEEEEEPDLTLSRSRKKKTQVEEDTLTEMKRSEDGLYHCSYIGACDETGRRVHLCSFCDEKCYSFKACIAHQATHKEQIAEKNILPDEQFMEQVVKAELQKEQTMDKRLKMEHPEPEEHTTHKKVDLGRPEEQTMEKRMGMELLKQPIIEKGTNYPPTKKSKLPTHANIAFGISQNRYGGPSSGSGLGIVAKTGGSSRHSVVKDDSNTFSGSMEMVEKKESDNNRPIRIMGFTVPESGVSDDVPAASSIKAAEPSQRTPKFNIDLSD